MHLHWHLHWISGRVAKWAALAAILAAMSCSSPSSMGSKEASFASGQAAGEKITEAQLQDSLFRFANRFASEVHDGTKNLESSPDPNIQGQALLRRLIYDSAVLDISLGPSPQANLLDMVAFIELSRGIWNDYWVPQLFKEQGAAMSSSFKQASDEIWSIAAKVMNEEQRNQLAKLVQRWRQKNPGQTAVENVRFSEFSKEAGARAEAMQSEVGGLLSSIQGATQAGDRAVLFSERALFFAQRAPFLWRLQAQAGTREVLSEAMTTLASSKAILDQQPQIHSLLNDVSETFASMSESLKSIDQHPDALKYGTTMITRLAEVLREWNRTLSSPQYGASLSKVSTISESIDLHANRFLWKLFGIGASLILLFGLVTLGSRLAYLKMSRGMIRRRRMRATAEAPRKAA